MKITPKHSGVTALKGSEEARKLAALILEVLSGLRRPMDVAQGLAISLARYYILEIRALQGLITALEPRTKGRQSRPEDDVARLKRDKERLERELSRANALVRSAQRVYGVPVIPPTKTGANGKQRKPRKAVVRAKRAIAALRLPDTAPPVVTAQTNEPVKESA